MIRPHAFAALALVAGLAQPGQAAGGARCVSVYAGASQSPPALVTTLDGMYEEDWADGHWLFFEDACRTRLIWSVLCSPDRACHGLHDGFTLQLGEDGHVTLARPLRYGLRVSYLVDGMIAQVPDLFNRPVGALLESYLDDEGHILIEDEDDRVETIDLRGFSAIVAFLRDMTGRQLVGEQPTIMLRYESLHDPFSDDLYVFLPATKPQIQFAIRAQGAVPFGPGNRNSTPESERE